MSPRVSIVFGGGRGIGAATARYLAARGDAVVIADRASDDQRLGYSLASPSDLEAAGESARGVGPRSQVVTIAADATDAASVGDVIKQTESSFGGVDAIVVTAGVIAGGVRLWEMPDAQIRAVLEANLESVITVARIGIPALLRRPTPRTGRLVAVTSTAASRGLPMLAAYCAAKAGVLGLVRALAVELRATGVTANTVSPGSTDTAILAESARLYGLENAQAFARQQPIERLLAPDEVASVIAFLSSAEAGGITGAEYAADGGLAI